MSWGLALSLSLAGCAGTVEGSSSDAEVAALHPAQRQWTTGLEVHYGREEAPAAFAILVLDYGAWGPPPYEQVILALWESGRLILSRNPRHGGAPFEEHACPPERAKGLLIQLQQKAIECTRVAPIRRPSEAPLQLVVVQHAAQRLDVWAYHPFRLPEEPRSVWEMGPEAARFEPLFDELVASARGVAAGCPRDGEVQVGALVVRKAPPPDRP